MEKKSNNKSKSLRSWGAIFMVIGTIVIFMGIIAAVASAIKDGIAIAAVGLGVVAVASIIDGLAVLVQNAEEQIAEREQRKNLPAE